MNLKSGHSLALWPLPWPACWLPPGARCRLCAGPRRRLDPGVRDRATARCSPGFPLRHQAQLRPANPAGLWTWHAAGRCQSGKQRPRLDPQGADFCRQVRHCALHRQRLPRGRQRPGSPPMAPSSCVASASRSPSPTWKPGPAGADGQATVKRLDFGVGGGDWADTKTIRMRPRQARS